MLPRDLQATERDPVSGHEKGLLDNLAVDRRSVGAAGVAQQPAAALLQNLSVVPGHPLVIEDDVVVTEKGCKNLSAGIPHTVKDVEAWMKAIWKKK